MSKTLQNNSQETQNMESIINLWIQNYQIQKLEVEIHTTIIIVHNMPYIFKV